nr:MAG TPA: hypothetical protein [Caudoviricetes sp.]
MEGYITGVMQHVLQYKCYKMLTFVNFNIIDSVLLILPPLVKIGQGG